MQNDWQKAKEILEKDGIVVLPTDTLYGITGRALSKKVIERIYKIKGRNENKPFIILISSYKDLEIFGVKINNEQAKFLKKIWPGKVSVIFPCTLIKFNYLHRGSKSIAFRMIGEKNKNLFNLLKKVGPLVAPSCNKQGSEPALDVNKAKDYFNNDIDYYVKGGVRESVPSTLIKFQDNNWVILRQGDIKIDVGRL